LKYHNPRETAFDIILKVLEEGAYTNLETYKKYKASSYSDLDKRFILEIAYGTVKHWNTIDWILEKFVSKPLEKQEPQIRNILRMGVYQLLYMDRVPPSAACNESVKLAKKFGHEGVAKFVNGVLRNVSRKYRTIEEVDFPDLNFRPISHISLKYSHPEWMVERWIKRFGVEDTIKLCKFNNLPPKHSIRVNTHRITIEEFKKILVSRKISFSPSKICPESLIIEEYGKLENEEELQNFYIPQIEASALIGHIVSPKPGQSILDACAAPGLKTTHLAQLIQDKGEIIALDIHKHRVELIKRNCERLGFSCVKAYLLDARRAQQEVKKRFDLILVDAPCSGTGVLNLRADARWRKSVKEIMEMKRLQQEITEGVIALLKPGASLIYSTCSLEPEENQQVIITILERHPELKRENLTSFLPCKSFVGPDALSLQLLPHVHGTEGFFAVRFTKT